MDEVGNFSTWRLQAKSLVEDGVLDEQACIELLTNFLKLLQCYCTQYEDNNFIMSQIICYTDRLMEVFNNPSSCIQLRAANLLQSKAMPVVKLVMKLSLNALDGDEKHTDSKYNT